MIQNFLLKCIDFLFIILSYNAWKFSRSFAIIYLLKKDLSLRRFSDWSLEKCFNRRAYDKVPVGWRIPEKGWSPLRTLTLETIVQVQLRNASRQRPQAISDLEIGPDEQNEAYKAVE